MQITKMQKKVKELKSKVYKLQNIAIEGDVPEEDREFYLSNWHTEEEIECVKYLIKELEREIADLEDKIILEKLLREFEEKQKGANQLSSKFDYVNKICYNICVQGKSLYIPFFHYRILIVYIQIKVTKERTKNDYRPAAERDLSQQRKNPGPPGHRLRGADFRGREKVFYWCALAQQGAD